MISTLVKDAKESAFSLHCLIPNTPVKSIPIPATRRSPPPIDSGTLMPIKVKSKPMKAITIDYKIKRD